MSAVFSVFERRRSIRTDILRTGVLDDALHTCPGPGFCTVARGIIHKPLGDTCGAEQSRTGNLKEYVNRDCWAFRDEIEHKYGRVVSLHGAFGVRFTGDLLQNDVSESA